MTLGKALPDGFVPMALESPLPARVEPDGHLRVQLRPGTWTLELTARHQGPTNTLAMPTTDAPWAAQEVWAFEAHNELRLVAVEGVSAIDPNQTRLPPEWRQFPTFLMQPGKAMRLDEKRRGNADPAPDQLNLQRKLWLDFSGRRLHRPRRDFGHDEQKLAAGDDRATAARARRDWRCRSGDYAR